MVLSSRSRLESAGMMKQDGMRGMDKPMITDAEGDEIAGYLKQHGRHEVKSDNNAGMISSSGESSAHCSVLQGFFWFSHEWS